MSEKKSVRLYPTDKAFIDGVPAVITDCTPEEAQRLLAYYPPAFTLEPPGKPVASPQPSKEL